MSDFVLAVAPCGLPCSQWVPSGPVIRRLKSRVVTGATNAQR